MIPPIWPMPISAPIWSCAGQSGSGRDRLTARLLSEGALEVTQPIMLTVPH